jgi:hypothetical protein
MIIKIAVAYFSWERVPHTQSRSEDVCISRLYEVIIEKTAVGPMKTFNYFGSK